MATIGVIMINKNQVDKAMPAKERAALEAKQAKAEADRKNKKRAEYGLPPLIDAKHPHDKNYEKIEDEKNWL